MREIEKYKQTEESKKKNIFGIIITVVIFLLFITFAIGLYINSSQNYKYQMYIVTSGSMEPTIKTGELIIVQKTGNYENNDIITFIQNGKIITHRIVQTLENGNFVTKGDSNSGNDLEDVNSQRILGEYMFGIEKLGYIFSFVKSKTGLVLLVIIPCVILIYDEIKKIINEIKNLKKRK